jgi:hypothetical protein
MTQTRINIINKFGSLSGFEIINTLLMSTDYKWIGAEHASTIIAAIAEVHTLVIINTVAIFSSIHPDHLALLIYCTVP